MKVLLAQLINQQLKIRKGIINNDTRYVSIHICIEYCGDSAHAPSPKDNTLDIPQFLRMTDHIKQVLFLIEAQRDILSFREPATCEIKGKDVEVGQIVL